MEMQPCVAPKTRNRIDPDQRDDLTDLALVACENVRMLVEDRDVRERLILEIYSELLEVCPEAA